MLVNLPPTFHSLTGEIGMLKKYVLNGRDVYPELEIRELRVMLALNHSNIFGNKMIKHYTFERYAGS